CTLLAQWEVGYRDPWLIVTDLPPSQAQAAWYGIRSWIEAGFKDLKRGGWHWQQTAMTDPARAERLWLVLAVATLWVVSVGGQPGAALPPSGFQPLPGLALPVHSRPRSRPRPPGQLFRPEHGPHFGRFPARRPLPDWSFLPPPLARIALFRGCFMKYLPLKAP